MASLPKICAEQPNAQAAATTASKHHCKSENSQFSNASSKLDLKSSAPQYPLKIRLAAAVIYYLLRLIYATCRVSELGETSLPKTPCLVLFWHSRLAFMGFLYALQRRRGYSKTPYVLISTHKDGLLISCVMAHFGIRTVQGSSNRGPVGALLAIRKVLAAGNDVFITPDGPRGPARTIAPGALAAAAKFSATLVVASNSATRAWRFSSWDAMILPKPFCRVCYALSSAVEPTENAAQAAFSALEKIQNEAGFYA